MTRIAEIDVYDDEAVRRWHHAEQASIDHDSPHAVPRPYDALVAYVREPNPRSRRILIAATTGPDQVVGTAEVVLPLADNTHLAHVSIQVDPGQRREGVGTSLLAAIDDAPWSVGRSTALGEVSGPVGGDPSAGLMFAEARGFATVHEEDHLVLELPLAGDRLAALGERASVSASDYEILTWGNRCPDELAEAYCVMRTTMNQDVPTGAVDARPSAYTLEGLRRDEERTAKAYDRVVSAVRLRSDGSLCGYSLVFLPHDTGQALQDDTLVMPAHRGQRLGQRLKLATLGVIQDEHPGRTSLHTWTDPDNHAMYRTNLRFGYTPVERMREVQRKRLPRLGEPVDRHV